jgi:hypothetical protein
MKLPNRIETVLDGAVFSFLVTGPEGNWQGVLIELA